MSFFTPDEQREPKAKAALEAAQSELNRLITERDAYAMAAVDGDSAAQKNYETWTKQVEAQQREITKLQAAYAGAVAFDRNQFLLAKKDRILGCFDAIHRRINERQKLVAQFIEQAEAASKSYRKIIGKTQDIARAWPCDLPKPWMDGFDHIAEMRKLISHELWRYSGSSDKSGVDDKTSMPAASPMDLSCTAVPNATPALLPIITRMDENLKVHVEKARAQLDAKLSATARK